MKFLLPFPITDHSSGKEGVLRACVRGGSSARTRAKRSWSRRKSEKAAGVLKYVEDLFRLTTQIHGLCSRVKPERLLTHAL